MHYWYSYVVKLTQQQVDAESAGNPTHWYNVTPEPESTRRFLALVMEKARAIVPM